jgi:DNA invertase Pin-like site-specific DNA recombinase
MFGMLGIFSEFEREMIVARVNAGLDRIKQTIERDGKFTAKKSGKVRDRLGRPGARPDQIDAAKAELSRGTGILKTARLTKLGTSTVQKLMFFARPDAARNYRFEPSSGFGVVPFD